jgi:hypothetical protein
MAERQAARRARGVGRLMPTATQARSRNVRGSPRPVLHVHWFRRYGDDPYSGASLYACRCGAVRPGF